jgi:hypothetical protein
MAQHRSVLNNAGLIRKSFGDSAYIRLNTKHSGTISVESGRLL